MKFFLRSNSIIQRFFFTYLIIFFVPVLFLGLMNYNWRVESIKRQTKQAYLDRLNLTCSSIESKFDELDEFSHTLAQTHWVRKIAFMQGNRLDYSRISAVTLATYFDELGNYDAINDFIEYIAIYINNMNIFLSQSGIDDFQWFFTQAFRYKGMRYSDWFGYLQGYNEPKVLPPMQVSRYGLQTDYLTYVRTLPILDQVPRANLLMMINSDTMLDLLTQVALDDNSSAYIFDSEHTLITATQTNDTIVEGLKRRLQAGTALGSDQYFRDGKGRKYFVFAVKSNGPLIDWTYVSLVPIDTVMGEVNQIKFFAIGIFVGLFILGIFSSYKLSNRDYKPLEKIIGIINSKSKYATANKNMNEYEIIEAEVKNNALKRLELEARLEDYRLIEDRNLVRKLLDGEVSVQKKDHYRQLLSKPGFRDMYAVAIFINFDKDKSMSGRIVGEHWCGYILKESKQLIAIINAKEADLDGNLRELRELMGPKTVAGSGREYRLEDVWRSYNEAQVAIEYEPIKAPDEIICFEKIQAKGDASYFYSSKHEMAIMARLKGKDFTALREIFSQHLKALVHYNSLPIAIERYLFYKTSAMSLDHLSDAAFKKIMTRFGPELETAQSPDGVRKIIEKIYNAFCDESLRQKNRYRIQLKESVLNFVDFNYYKPSMSLLVLADNFDMSQSQMSIYFKTISGKKFHDYLSELRINVAKKLLQKDELSIEEIGRQVGYDNVKTFRRVFKKIENKTPGKYKELKQ